jgi:alpha-tubulin suppressor-like RCC1 family protein
LKNDNTLWGSGDNERGQLGLGHTNSQHTLIQILQQDTPGKLLRQPIDNIKSVSCGCDYTLILKNDNTLWGSGDNNRGQLGLGHTNDKHTFIQLHIDNIKSVSCGGDHTLILKNDNTLWGSGYNHWGQLGLGHTNNLNIFVQLLQQDTPAKLLRQPIDNIKSVSCDSDHTLILKNDNTLWGSGYNHCGQLGLGHTNNLNIFVQLPIDNIKSVSSGYSHTLILKNDNTFWATGDNIDGELGLGHTNQLNTFVQLPQQDTPVKLLRQPIDNIKSVSCGNHHTLILKNDNTLWGSGYNNNGELGLGHRYNQHTFVQLHL